MIPRQWKVIQTIREKFSCRAGSNLLVLIMAGEFLNYQPLNRQSQARARGDRVRHLALVVWMGAYITSLAPLVAWIAAHVLAVERLHGDDITVMVLANAAPSLAGFRSTKR